MQQNFRRQLLALRRGRVPEDLGARFETFIGAVNAASVQLRPARDEVLDVLLLIGLTAKRGGEFADRFERAVWTPGPALAPVS